MPIKRIQLRGISRRPSDRMNADGGCAESLNVHLEEGELAPTQAPQNVTASYCDTGDEPDKFIFIHKWGSYEHMIGIDGQAVEYMYTGGPSTILTLGTGETLSDIKSVGNTLIVASSEKLYYALWTGTEYKFIGNQIPIPQLSFRIGNMTKMRVNAEAAEMDFTDPDLEDSYSVCSVFYSNWEIPVPSVPHSTVGETANYGKEAVRYVFGSSDDEGYWNVMLDRLWGDIDKYLHEQTQYGKAVFPMFVRYAVRLYDGTVYAQSIPVLLGGDISKFIDIRTLFLVWHYNDITDTPKLATARHYVDVAEAFSVYLNRVSASTIFDDWKDIVEGVDIFVSPQMYPVLRNAAKFRSTFAQEYVDELVEDAQGRDMMCRQFYFDNFSLDPYYMEDRQEELVKMYQTTYLVKSFTVDELKALSGDVLLDDINLSSDWLLTQEALKETPGSMHMTKALDLFTYNKRLMLGQASQELFHGYAFLPSVKWGGTASGASYVFVYHIRGSNGECIVRSRNVSGTEAISSRTSSALVVDSSTTRAESLCAWVSYPDARCYLVDIFKTSGNATTKVSLPMNPSAELDIAYAFFGFGTAPSFASTSDTPATEKATYAYDNSLLISKFENPFVFDTTDIVSFDGKVISMAAITHPLSQGQVGQFALYVFTDEGIVSPAIRDDGGFGAISVVSRDVLLSKTALVAVEQGIFFVTKKGVMLLQGMEITDISKNMVGWQYVLDTALSDKVPSACSGFVADSTPFMSFMASCHIAFDYTGRRLIFFNATKAYQYVYMFETETWHKMATASGAVVVLNSYPDCLVSIGDGLYRFDTVIDNAAYLTDTDTTKIRSCVIITRSFDLDEPDVRKAIRSIRIRGRFNRNDVQYLLLGTMDGMHWKLLPSLRGGSYKAFRLFIRASLAPTERISWVDVDYESRYATKLR